MQLQEYIDAQGEAMAESLSAMVKIPAIAPKNGGGGESKRADFLEAMAKSFGLSAKRYDYTDGSEARRSNLIVTYGSGSKTLWLVAHMDTVAVGDPKLWKRDPFAGTIENGRVYGRGSSDDGQDVIASLYAMKALKENGIKPRYRFGIAIVGDEETGNEFGITRLIAERIFGKDDFVLVPDAGNETGTAIEIVEKGMLRLRITVKGKAAHASRPNTGVNSLFHYMKFVSHLSEYLYGKYGKTDDIFYPTSSTFEATKNEANMNSENAIPGIQVGYMDCRVLPYYDVNKILKDIRAEAADYQRGVKGLGIEIEATRAENAPRKIDTDSEFPRLVYKAVKRQIGREPEFVGKGGRTCAFDFRERGIAAVVWSVKEEVAHNANEYCVIDEMKTDAKVFASLFE